MIKGWSYFGVRNPRHVATDLDDMIEHGANAVLFTVSEEDMAYYARTMESLVKLAKDREMVVYMNPWKFGGVFGGEAFSGFLMRHPETMQIDSAGKPVPAACLNNELFHQYLAKWVKLVADCGADVAMWDEPHFFIFHWEKSLAHITNRWVCRCETCKQFFEQKYRYALPKNENDDIIKFREDSILHFLDFFTRLAKSQKLQNSVCVLPPNFNWNDGINDIEKVFQLEAVDIVATDPYWRDNEGLDIVKENYTMNSKKLIELAVQYEKQPEMWIKNFNIVSGQENKIELANQVAFEAGIRRILAWSYLGSDYMSSLRSSNPQKVYETQSGWFKRMN